MPLLPSSSFWTSCRWVVRRCSPSSGGRLTVSSTRLCPTRSQQGRVFPTRHPPGTCQYHLEEIKGSGGRREQNDSTYLLLELLVDGIKCILDCDSLQISGGDLEAQGEVQVNLLDWGVDEF